MIRLCSFLMTALLCIFLATYPAWAGDEGLYPDAPPPGSAFVRFANAGNSPTAAITLADKSYGTALRGDVTRYVPTPAGSARVIFGGVSTEAALIEGQRYCATLVNGRLALLKEPSDGSPMKAQLILINASNRKNVSLKTADGTKIVIDPVATGALGYRAVNAVKAPFAVYAQDVKIKDIEARDLERGQRYAIVVYDDAGQTAVKFN